MRPFERPRRASALHQVATEPDLVVVNARVYTLDDARLPRAEAFRDQRPQFIASGCSCDIRNLATGARR